MPIRICLAFLGLTMAATAGAQTAVPPLIPLPAEAKIRSGVFTLADGTRVFAPRSEADTARLLVGSVRREAGVNLELRFGDRPRNYTGGVELALDPSLTALGPEGYRLEVSAEGVSIRASGKAGLFYGVQTLRQLLPLRAAKGACALPFASIEDKPRFAWRGFMLDSARHFMRKQTILKLLDALATVKINRFHWHLVDNDAWRIAIAKYPDLVKPLPIKADWYTQADGYYTPSDIREVTAKAKSLHITVIPEIEMPGHAMQAASILPEVACLKPDGTPIPVGGTREICLGSDKAVQAFQDILVETMALFPDSPVIHLGGDEADDSHWRECPRCQARMKELGITDARMLQKWFMNKMNRFVLDGGRRSMAWADRLDLDIPENQIVHGWHGGESQYAVGKGFQTVHSDHIFTYFDYGQGPGDTLFAGMGLPIERVYSFDPVAGMTEQQGALVLGPQAQLWAELVVDSRVMAKVFPRILALAEVGWTPQALRRYDDFTSRLGEFLPRLDAQDIPYFKMPTQLGRWSPSEVSEDWKDLEWDVTRFVKKGMFRVEFLYTGGAHALEIESVSLLLDGHVTSTSGYSGFGRAGAVHQDNVYRVHLNWDPRGGTITLRARVRSVGGTDSNGVIVLR